MGGPPIDLLCYARSKSEASCLCFTLFHCSSSCPRQPVTYWFSCALSKRVFTQTQIPLQSTSVITLKILFGYVSDSKCYFSLSLHFTCKKKKKGLASKLRIFSWMYRLVCWIHFYWLSFSFSQWKSWVFSLHTTLIIPVNNSGETFVSERLFSALCSSSYQESCPQVRVCACVCVGGWVCCIVWVCEWSVCVSVCVSCMQHFFVLNFVFCLSYFL